MWDNDAYDFLTGDAPATVNLSLWRQSSLVARQGLYEVAEGIYQVRGLDLSNVTFVEGETGVIAIDPLICVETAAAAYELYTRHRGDRPVTGVIYTHSHVDHYAGVKALTSQEAVDAGACAVLAPAGFLEHAVSELVYAGPAMSRRAAYMYGAALSRGLRGQVGAGLGQTNSTGTVTLIRPTVDVTRTGQTEVVDGVTVEFQLTPGTEAPAEMHFLFPDFGALCIAENATHTLHNLLTLRGAQVRDARMWAHYLTEAVELFTGRTEVVFSPHHWPTWGRERVVEFLSLQRDLYAYLHDQTLRLLNRGLTGVEIAEVMRLPPALEQAWHARGYYGSVNHNVKAIYQRYMGWYDGNPANLWPHPPTEAGSRYLEFMGGADAVVGKARAAFDDGDFRWVAEVVNHIVQVDPGHAAATQLLADTYEQLAYGAENGTWRSIYLSATHELRHGSVGTPVQSSSPDTVAQLTDDQLLDALALQVDGPRCWDLDLRLAVDVTDGERHRVTLRNGVLVHTGGGLAQEADATVRLPRAALAALAGGGVDPADLPDEVEVEGDDSVLRTLLGVLQPGDPDFPIVTSAVRT